MQISHHIRRILWALGLVRIRVTPGIASLTCGGELPLTISFEPRPCHRATLRTQVNNRTVVSTDGEMAVSPNSSNTTMGVYGEHLGKTALTIEISPTRRLGRGMQGFFAGMAKRLGLGSAEITLNVQSSPLLIVAPHPDDEALMASGVIANAVAKGESVKVVIVTNGDHLREKKEYGLKRQSESVAAMKILGLQSDDVIFLGYPGDVRGLLNMLNNHDRTGTAYASIAGASETYGAHGLGNQDFHSWLTGEPAVYRAGNLQSDLEALLKAFRPRHIYTTSRFDEHPDHRAVYYFLLRVIQLIEIRDSSYVPTLHTAVIHDVTSNTYEDFWESDQNPPPISADFTGDDFWPLPNSECEDGADNCLPGFTPPINLWRTSLTWGEVEKLPVPPAMRTNSLGQNLKYRVLQQYASQPLRYLAPFCKSEEVFWQEEPSHNELLAVAPLNLIMKTGEAYVIAVSLVQPASRMRAIAVESSDGSVVTAPVAVLVRTGKLTSTFAVKAARQGKATVSANLGTKQTLATVTVMDSDESLLNRGPFLQ